MKEYAGKERRRFLRCTFDKPVYYSVAELLKGKKSISPLLNALGRNLSACGILFATKKAPEISSFLVVDVDYPTAEVCKEIENNALIVKNKLLGKVVRINDTEDGLCDVGVAFVMKNDNFSKTKDIENLLDKIGKRKEK